MATRLELPDGRWIDVKEKLSVKDKRNVNTYSNLAFTSDGEAIRMDFYKNRIGNAAVRILNWSEGFVDENGQPVWWKPASSFDERTDTIDRLEESTLNDLEAAIAKFIEDVEKAAVQEKNATPDGEKSSAPTSPSAEK